MSIIQMLVIEMIMIRTRQLTINARKLLRCNRTKEAVQYLKVVNLLETD